MFEQNNIIEAKKVINDAEIALKKAKHVVPSNRMEDFMEESVRGESACQQEDLEFLIEAVEEFSRS